MLEHARGWLSWAIRGKADMKQAGHQGVTLKWDQVVFSSDEPDQNSRVGETIGQEPATCVPSQGLLPGVSMCISTPGSP